MSLTEIIFIFLFKILSIIRILFYFNDYLYTKCDEQHYNKIKTLIKYIYN